MKDLKAETERDKHQGNEEEMRINWKMVTSIVTNKLNIRTEDRNYVTEREKQMIF